MPIRRSPDAPLTAPARPIWAALAGAALVVLGVLTFAGLAAPLWPALDMSNQMRHLMGLVGLALVVLAGPLGWRWVVAAFALLLVNAILLVAALALVPSPKMAGEDGIPLRVATFNVWGRNADLDAATDAVLAMDADLVVLQELRRPGTAVILERLGEAFPFRLDCSATRYCGMAIASRHPLRQVEAGPSDGERPARIRALASIDDQTIEIVAIHTVYPLRPTRQARDFAWMEAHIAAGRHPMIVLGDFNATPWSSHMVAFGRASGLARVGTFGATWPAPGVVRGWPFPFALIDHVMVSDDIGVRRWDIAPPAGSDHLPIVVDLELPPSERS